jgi:hypothetical protein
MAIHGGFVCKFGIGMCMCYTKAKYVIQIELKIMYKHISRHFFLHLSFHRSVITSLPRRGSHNFNAQAHHADILNVGAAKSNRSDSHYEMFWITFMGRVYAKFFAPNAQDKYKMQTAYPYVCNRIQIFP